MVLGARDGLSIEEQEYNPTPIIKEIRSLVDDWRRLPNPGDWQTAPETTRLLQHWRDHPFNSIRPFFCQVEAVETIIWLTEVADSAQPYVLTPVPLRKLGRPKAHISTAPLPPETKVAFRHPQCPQLSSCVGGL